MRLTRIFSYKSNINFNSPRRRNLLDWARKAKIRPKSMPYTGCFTIKFWFIVGAPHINTKIVFVRFLSLHCTWSKWILFNFKVNEIREPIHPRKYIQCTYRRPIRHHTPSIQFIEINSNWYLLIVLITHPNAMQPKFDGSAHTHTKRSCNIFVYIFIFDCKLPKHSVDLHLIF